MTPLRTGDPASPSRDRASHGAAVGVSTLRASPAIAQAGYEPLYRSLDLFSCVGCHALGFERAGIRTEMFCEINPWRRARLAEQFPGVPIHDDIRTFDRIGADVWVDIVIGGPPCQATAKPAAVHGKRTGESLWSYMLLVVRNFHPDWVVVEQPPGNAAWETEVSDALYAVGRNVARFEFGACDFGAPYIRRRVFLVACSSLPRLEIARQALPSAIELVKGAADSRGDWNPAAIPPFGVDTWRSERVDDRRQRIEALGDSNPPHMAEAIGLAIRAAQGIVTEGQDPKGLGERVARVEPDPTNGRDAP